MFHGIAILFTALTVICSVSHVANVGAQKLNYPNAVTYEWSIVDPSIGRVFDTSSELYGSTNGIQMEISLMHPKNGISPYTISHVDCQLTTDAQIPQLITYNGLGTRTFTATWIYSQISLNPVVLYCKYYTTDP